MAKRLREDSSDINPRPLQRAAPMSGGRRRKPSVYGSTPYWRGRYWHRRVTGKGSYRAMRRRTYGRGAYTQNPNDSFGKRWGGYLGANAGEWLGDNAIQLAMMAGKAIGLGDYAVSKNVLTGNLPVMTNPISSTGNTIRFQEYLGDIVTSVNPGEFKSSHYTLNAADPNTFPWLSQIASNYEQYEIEGLLFYFKSTSADALNSTNTALGTVMLATQYDVMDSVFGSKAEMLNYEYSSSGKPSDTIVHMIECDPRQQTINLLYALPAGSSVPDGADPRLYNLGRFTIATTGFQAASVNIGELHCTYQVRLLKPKLVDGLGITNPFLSYHGNVEGTAGSVGIPIAEVSSAKGPRYVNQQRINFPISSIESSWTMTCTWQATTTASHLLPTLTGDSPNITATIVASAPLAGADNTMMLQAYITVKASTNRESMTFGPNSFLQPNPVDVYININKVNPESHEPV